MKQKTYIWNSDDYARHSSNQFIWARELAAKLKLRGDESLLDIGCGDGKVTAYIASLLPHGRIVGMDNSPSMIALAQQKNSTANLSFVLSDARSIQFINEFDIAFSNAALHWVKDHRTVLNRVYQCLKPSGRILFQMGGKGNAEQVIAASEQIIRSRRWHRYFRQFEFPYGFYEPDDYRVWLDQSGFKCLRAEILEKDMLLNGREGLAGWIRTTWLPYTQQVPAARRDDYIVELADCYINSFPPDKSGVVHVRMMRLEVEAVKL
jgi:trans-aconitate 2-methyltransferase